MSVYSSYLLPTIKMLRHVDVWLTKAEAHAAARGYDVNVLMSARLAPDQYAFGRQVQAACDAAKLGAARLTGKEPPVHADDESTVAELRARVDSVLAWLGALTPADFEGWADRPVRLGFAQGKVILGQDYLVEMAIPNFYFHACMVYAILRHNGVELGKRDYIGPLSLKEEHGG